MALTERVELDLRDAQRQITQLEQQLQSLSTPIDVPVDVTGGNELADIRRELGLAESSVEGLNTELSQTDSELRQAGTQAKRTGDDIESAGRRGGAAFSALSTAAIGVLGAFSAVQGARAFLGFASDAIDAASDLEESTSKAQVVFGEFFDEIEAFAQTGPQALGLANAQALEFTGTFGNLFVALGLSQQAAADLAPEIVQLGADLASFNNIEVTEALDKLRAGLVGESEPLRVLGVNLTAASTAAKAVELGLAASTTEVSEAAKVQARYAQILEQTTTAQGDYARTSEGIANTQRTLSAELEEARASFGEALLPLFESIVQAAPGAIEVLEGFIPIIQDIVFEMENAFRVGDDFIDFLRGVADEGTGAADALEKAADEGDFTAGVLQRLGATPVSGIEELVRDSIGLTDALAELREEAAKPFPTTVSSLVNTFRDLDPGGTAGAFTRTLEELGRAAGATDDEFELFLRILSAQREELGLTAGEIQVVEGLLSQFADSAGLIPPRLDELVGGVSRFTQATEGAGDAAEESILSFDRFGTAVSSFPASNIDDIVNDIEAELERLPGLLEGARTSLQGEDGPITDADTFIGNLLTDLEELENFQADINIARALGLDDTAALATELGPEFAGVLSDAVSDPATAAQLESAIEGFAEAEAAFTRQAITTELTNQFQDAIDVPLNIDFILGNVRFPGAGNLLENIDLGPGPTPTAPTQERRGRGSNIEVNFYTEPAPTPETQRAVQQVSELARFE